MVKTSPDYDASLEHIIQEYDNYMDHADSDSKLQTSRAASGYIRHTKGKLVETITKKMVAIAWLQTGGDRNQLWFDSRKIIIPIKQSALDKFPADVASYIRTRSEDFIYKFSVDIHVFIQGRFAVGIELSLIHI